MYPDRSSAATCYDAHEPARAGIHGILCIAGVDGRVHGPAHGPSTCVGGRQRRDGKVSAGPLAALLAAAMVGVACFHAGRLALSAWWRRPTEADVDLTHIAMGVAMAGMLIGWSWGAGGDVWIVLFAGSSAWFARNVARELSDPRTSGLGVAHHLPHLVASAVMLYMLWAMRWTGMAGMGASAAGRAAGAAGGPTLLSFVLAALVVANAVSAAWTARVVRAAPRAGGAAPRAGGAATAGGTANAAEVLGSRGALGCLVVMSLAMAYMVVAAHP